MAVLFRRVCRSDNGTTTAELVVFAPEPSGAQFSCRYELIVDSVTLSAESRTGSDEMAAVYSTITALIAALRGRPILNGLIGRQAVGDLHPY